MTGSNLHVFEDGSFCVNQYTVHGRDPVIYFGPLRAKLSELFFMGFNLRATGYIKRAAYTTCKIHLIRGKEKYLVGKMGLHHLLSATPDTLQTVIRDGAQMLGKVSEEQRGPFEQLERKYPPIKRKKDIMIGNQTLRQFVENM